MTHVWRTGRKVGRTIYRQLGDQPSDDDPLIGVMDTPELARLAIKAVNQHLVRSASRQQKYAEMAHMDDRRDPRCRCSYEVDGRHLNPACPVHP